MKTILGHNGTTKDTAPKPVVVNVEEGVPKLLLFGILGRGEKVWAEVVSDVEARALLPRISRRVELGSIICSGNWKS